jgi:pyruvate, orthophosphate dikinase
MTVSTLRTTLTHNVATAMTDERATLGGKGSGLVEMTRMGLRVPPAFVLSTQCCDAYLSARRLPADLVEDVRTRLAELAEQTGKSFGQGPDPLLLSVRSGAPVSMPGMMDTVLNLGLNRDAFIALADRSNSMSFVADVLARFHAMYAEIVLDVFDPPASPASSVIDELGSGVDAGVLYDALWTRLQAGLEEAGEETVPDDPDEQLLGAIEAVFRSWNTRRAITYRDLHGIDHGMGTAVVVQAMVFGNRDADSGSGVVFSRNPVTGEPGMYGEYLAASQGEDVVAGTRTPDPVASLSDRQPTLFEELSSTVGRLEAAQRDVLDIEFTVESGTLYFLQVRSAKRTAPAAVRIATDFLAEYGDDAGGILSAVTPEHLRSLAQPRFDDDAMATARTEGRLLASGTGASPGHVSGRLALSPDRAEEMAAAGESVILARGVTSPTDLHGMIASAGVVTATGGATSHAAVVARALGLTCVVGCVDLSFDEKNLTMRAGDQLLREGDHVSLDGNNGDVYVGEIPVVESSDVDRIDDLAAFCLRVSGAELFVRAATVDEIGRARRLGAAGVVVAAADLLATHPRFADVTAEIAAHRDEGRAFDALADVLAEAFAPLFDAARGLEFGVRAIDFLVDETSELLGSDAVIVEQPELALPLGAPALVAAHLRGLQRARDAVTGSDAPNVHLSVRNISDAGEASILRELAAESELVSTGAYVSSPRGALHTGDIGAEVDRVWVELRLLQAAMFGLPPRLLLTKQPLEDYAASGALASNPRDTVDDSVAPLLDAVAKAAQDSSSGGIGVRLSGPVSAPLVRSLYDRGIRRFAVDFAESGPAVLALAKAAIQL